MAVIFVNNYLLPNGCVFYIIGKVVRYTDVWIQTLTNFTMETA